MDNVWQFVDKLIREPPPIVATMVAAIVVSFTLSSVLKKTKEFPMSGRGLFEAFEIFMAILLAVLTLQAYVYGRFVHSHAVAWYQSPLILLIILVSFTIISAIAYMCFTVFKIYISYMRQQKKK